MPLAEINLHPCFFDDVDFWWLNEPRFQKPKCPYSGQEGVTSVSNVHVCIFDVTSKEMLICFKLLLFSRQQDTVVDKLGDMIDSLLQAFNIGNVNGTMNFNQFPYKSTQVVDSHHDVSIGDNVGTAAYHGSNTCLSHSDLEDSLLDVSISNVSMAAERTPSRNEDNAQCGTSTLRYRGYHGSHTRLSQLVEETSCADTHPQ